MGEKGGTQDKEEEEMGEKKTMDRYLPEKIISSGLECLVDGVITASTASVMSDTGKVVSGVKAKVGASADGGEIAKIVKEKLTTK